MNSLVEEESATVVRRMLIRALEAHEPLAVIQFLVRQNPNVLFLASDNSQENSDDEDYILDDDGTPLHVAFQHAASMEVIDFLIRKCPDALGVVDMYHCTPLHFACACNDVPLSVIKLMIRLCPQTIGMQNLHGATPLHIACEFRQRRANDFHTRMQQRKGPFQDPEETEPRCIIEYLAHEWPLACCLVSSSGKMMPLDLVFEANQGDETIECVERVTLGVMEALTDAAVSGNTTMPDSLISHLESKHRDLRNSLSASIQGEADSYNETFESIQRLVRNDELQTILRQEKYQSLIIGILRMNRVGRKRIWRQHGSNERRLDHFLHTIEPVRDNLSCVFFQLMENPSAFCREGQSSLPLRHV